MQDHRYKRMDGSICYPCAFYIYIHGEAVPLNIIEYEVIRMAAAKEFKPDIGKKAIVQHETELEDSLKQLAFALSNNIQFNSISEFFHAFICGFWDPFEEACAVEDRRNGRLHQELIELEQQLRDVLEPESYQQFCRYGDLIAQRNSVSLENAFLVGFQCAIRFLLLGIVPAAQIMQQEEGA